MGLKKRVLPVITIASCYWRVWMEGPNAVEFPGSGTCSGGKGNDGKGTGGWSGSCDRLGSGDGQEKLAVMVHGDGLVNLG